MLTNVVVKNEPLDNNFEDMIAQQSNTKQEFIFNVANIKGKVSAVIVCIVVDLAIHQVVI
uniref:Uncharacterized protein n=1 Tax=Glossina palpalis gambiensis TaxID=67801 RepID=A0A1B0BZU2_9MUSC